ncbi:MAG: choline kinase [Halobacteriovorax sp.]|nr:choline kinase [Halobacteriovorax sp.]|tara:strand:+ start:314392 stop:315297 length:906 start_codon:yes stop_codon:yes gene_type:complete
MKEIILELTDSKEIIEIKAIQELWSGYGVLNRVTTEKTSVIEKLINIERGKNHPRGWDTDFSHQRKAKSYEVEMNFYKNFNNEIPFAYSPRFLAAGKRGHQQYLILEDLKTKCFSPKASVNDEEIKLCLKWLAKFHAHYLGTSPTGLWEIGTYWHLDTRPDEFKAIEDIELKKAAPLIDKKLNAAKFKTFVHGDAKLANFLFSDTEAAAVDFQYIGGGVGVKDLAYFLSSIYREDDLEKYEAKWLDYYFGELNNLEVEKEWRGLYPYAWCDFYRFLKGWSPGHPKLNSYSEKMKDKVLKCL